jgi:hypothetical protein
MSVTTCGPASGALLRRGDLAKRFGVRRECIAYWQRVGLVSNGVRVRLKGQRVGGAWRFTEADVREFLTALNGPTPRQFAEAAGAVSAPI